MWGISGIYAFRAYSQQVFLSFATQIWEAYSVWAITEEDAQRGFHPLKNVTFLSECNGSEYEVYSTKQPNSDSTRSFECRSCILGNIIIAIPSLTKNRNSIWLANYPRRSGWHRYHCRRRRVCSIGTISITDLTSTNQHRGSEHIWRKIRPISDRHQPTYEKYRLSAYLYAFTDNQTFFTAANTSRTFIDAHLYNRSGGYVRDSFGIQRCDTGDDLIRTYNTGLYLEALGVLANKTNDLALMQTYVSIIILHQSTSTHNISSADEVALNAIKSPSWTGTTGILTDIGGM